MRQIIICKMVNQAGTLNRFTGLLARRNINIERVSIISTGDHQLAEAEFQIRVPASFQIEHLKRVIAKQADILTVDCHEYRKTSSTNHQS